jgi:nucleoside-diphosphate-sugar epimerase
MKVLVTGGAGYIGSILCRMLIEKGFDVICLDRFFFGFDSIEEIRDKIKIVKEDIRWFNPNILKNIDAVIDMASLSNDPSGELDPQKNIRN